MQSVTFGPNERVRGVVAALNCTHGARYSNPECVFLQMIKSIQF